MNSDTERLPPQNRSAENAVLGSILRWPEALLDVGQLLTPGDFYQHHHQQIFAAMLRLCGEGTPVDLLSVYQGVKAAGFEKDCPPAYLAKLWDNNPTGNNAAYYAGLVKDASIRRSLIHAANEIIRDAYDGTPGAELLEQAERSIFQIADVGSKGDAVPIKFAVTEAMERIEAVALGKAKAGGLPTGFIDLDIILGGLHPGELTVVGARPSVGKSAFGLSLLHNVTLGGGGALFVSLEMSKSELAHRLLSSESRIDSGHMKKAFLTESEWGRLADARNVLERPNVFIDDTPAQRVFRIAATARRLKLKHEIALVVIDYVQLIDPEDRRAPRQEQVASFSRRLKLMARELKIPVVAMAQLNRGVEERQNQRPKLSDLRESGALEQDPDNVILLHRDETRPGCLDVIVAKQRNGPTGAVTLAWLSHCMRFDNWAPNYSFGEVHPTIVSGE